MKLERFALLLAFALATPWLSMGCGGDEAGADAGDVSVDGADADPCQGLPRCARPGTACNGDTLVTCELNAYGCLVETYEDCSLVEDGFCDDSVEPAECAIGGPCYGLPECEVEGRHCDADVLVVCEVDSNGCLVETRTDCTTLPVFEFGGECDDTIDPPACVGFSDPCEGLETLCDLPGRECDGDDLIICALNPLGCLVETIVDCTDTGEVCDPYADPAPACVDPCSLVETCPAEVYCDGNVLVMCEPDEYECLVSVDRQNCVEDRLLCDDTLDPPECVARNTCPEAMPIDCTSGMVIADTSDVDDSDPPYATDQLDQNDCAYGSYLGNEYLFEFTNPLAAYVTILSTRTSGTGDFDLFALWAGESVCAEETSLCLDGSTGSGTTEIVEFDVLPGEYVFVVYDLYTATDSSETAQFSLEIECKICGDGEITFPEECDDGNGLSGDGCSVGCAVEEGWSCLGEPSMCHFMECGNGYIENDEQCDDENHVAGDGCSSSCLIETGWSCRGEPSICLEWECGNGYIDPGEDCDDENTETGDGCDDDCEVESGSHCLGEPSDCFSGGDVCEEAISIPAGTYHFDNTGFTNDYDDYTGGNCGSNRSGSGPDVVFEVTVPGRTVLRAVMDGAPSEMDETMALVDSCTDLVDHCLEYGDDPTAEVEYFNTASDEITLYLVVDGYFSYSEGEFSLTVELEPVVCGDGEVYIDEDCDDGDNDDDDGCSAICEVEEGWLCSGSPSVCRRTVCGDGIIEGTEDCDDNEATPDGNDGCSATCRVEDGWVCLSEPSICHEIECGDGLVEGEEECDLGDDNSDTGRCTTHCTLAVCGDGFVKTSVSPETFVSPVVTNPFGYTGHVCDDFSACIYITDCYVSEDGDAEEHGICQALGYDRAVSVNWGYGAGASDSTMPHVYNWECVDFVCGPGDNSYSWDNCDAFEMLQDITCENVGGELCDEGDAEHVEEGPYNSDEPDAPSGCRTDCTPVRCGDNIIDSGEECDDGNRINDDACNNNCEEPVCGDSIIQEVADEECDVGGTPPWPGCDAECHVVDGWVCYSEPSICVEGGDTCDEAIPLDEGRYEFDSTGFTNDYDDYQTGACTGATGGAGPDMVFSVQVGARTILDVSMRGLADGSSTMDEYLVLADDCDTAGIVASCLGFQDEPGDVTYFNDGTEPVTVFIVADGNPAASEGPFSLTIEFEEVVCGDGIIHEVGVEECDDQNGDALDGCSSICEIEEGYRCYGEPSVCVQGGDDCGEAIDLQRWLDLGWNTFTFDTTDYNNRSDDYGGECGDDQAGAGRDMVFEVELQGSQAIEVTMDATWSEVLVIADACDLGFPDHCQGYSTDGFASYRNSSDAPIDLYVVADGVDSSSYGIFTLEFDFVEVTCGDGVNTAYEECDDGDTEGGDGCSPDCLVESGWACVGDPSACHETVCGDGAIEGEEECDDSNTDDDDGCSSICEREGVTCQEAIELGAGSYTFDTTEYSNDYDDYGGTCGTDLTGAGPDMAFLVTVPAGHTLTATMDPTGGFDAVLVASTTCPGITASCVQLSDDGYSGDSERVGVINSGASAVDYYIIADGYFSTSDGEFDLTITLD